jgi:hypothetical protein
MDIVQSARANTSSAHHQRADLICRSLRRRHGAAHRLPATAGAQPVAEIMNPSRRHWCLLITGGALGCAREARRADRRYLGTQVAIQYQLPLAEVVPISTAPSPVAATPR